MKEEIEWLKNLLDVCYDRGTDTDQLFIKAVIRYAKGMWNFIEEEEESEEKLIARK